MYQQELRIPKERIAVLIGEKARTKRKLERLTGTKLEINSKEGYVGILGEDSVGVFLTKSIIQAIGRGFNPEVALELLNEDNSLEVINIQDYAKKSKKKLIRLRSRVIGTKGKAKKTIETITHTRICVYGKTISVIGNRINTILARKGIERLLEGSKHGNVYRWLERHKY